MYSQRGWGSLNEVVRIPVIDYLGVLVLIPILALLARLGGVAPDEGMPRPD